MVEAYPEHTVHVLTVRQDDPAVHAQLDNYRALLNEEERSREKRFHFDADKERFVIGRSLARLQISRFLGGDPRRWQFVNNQYGRPQLVPPEGAPPLGFNVSHTKGLIACAIAATHDVGVDVECIDRSLSHEIADRFFAPREVADLRALPRAEQGQVFFDYWTLKEAYIKARGMGLALPLAHFAFSLAPPHPPTVAFEGAIEDEPATWQFVQSWPTPTHRLALAVRRRPGTDLEVRLEATVPTVPA